MLDSSATTGATGLLFGLAFYFAPAIVAFAKHHPKRVSISFLTLFLGWTGIGWIVALVWALRAHSASNSRATELVAVTRPSPAIVSAPTAPPKSKLVESIPGDLKRILKKNLGPQEQVVVQLNGAFKEALVCTNSRVMILKSGIMTGQFFGSNLFQLPYRSISTVEVKFHLMTGYFEVSAGGMQNRAKKFWSGQGDVDPAKAPNCVALMSGGMADRFRQASALILERVQAPVIQPNLPQAPSKNVPDDIERLWSLHQAGAISLEEYTAAKSRALE